MNILALMTQLLMNIMFHEAYTDSETERTE